jgi:predicted RNase H-like HicB family nuclease
MAKYTAVFEQAEDVTWSCYVPDLPRILAMGDTRDEAEADMKAAVDIWIGEMKAAGTPIRPLSFKVPARQNPAGVGFVRDRGPNALFAGMDHLKHPVCTAAFTTSQGDWSALGDKLNSANVKQLTKDLEFVLTIRVPTSAKAEAAWSCEVKYREGSL